MIASDEKRRLYCRRIAFVLLVASVFYILCKTLLLRTPFEGKHYEPELFWSYKVLDIEWMQMLCNVLLFIPFGMTLSVFDRKLLRVLLIGCLFSFCIELTQYWLKLGLCEWDDVFHNSLGTLIGCYLHKLLQKIAPAVRRAISKQK